MAMTCNAKSKTQTNSSSKVHPDNGDGIDADRLLRLKSVLAVFPVSRSAWWEGIRSGIYPPPVRIGIRSVAWRDRDIKRLVEQGISPLKPERAR